MKKNVLFSLAFTSLMCFTAIPVQAGEPITVANFENNGTDRMINGRFTQKNELSSKLEVTDRPTAVTGYNTSSKVLKVYDTNERGMITLNLSNSDVITEESDKIRMTDGTSFIYNTLTLKYARTGDFFRPQGSGEQPLGFDFRAALEGRTGDNMVRGTFTPAGADNQWHTVTFTFPSTATPNVSFIQLYLLYNDSNGDGTHFDVFRNCQIYLDDIVLSNGPLTSTPSNKYESVSAFSNDRKLQIKNAPVGSEYTVYNLLGAKLHTSNIDNSELFSFNAPGTYIISINVAGTGDVVTRKIFVQ